MLDINPFKWGPTPFRFEHMWLIHLHFKDILGGWRNECRVEGWEDHKFMKNLQFVKSKLKEWNKVSFGELKEKKKIILLDIVVLDEKEQEGNFLSHLAARKTLRKRELEDVSLKEEVFWRQKSRAIWINEGDCNSKFFHRVPNRRRNRKYIKSLVTEDGVILNNIKSISKEIKRHFEKLFSKPLGGS